MVYLSEGYVALVDVNMPPILVKSLLNILSPALKASSCASASKLDDKVSEIIGFVCLMT